RALGIAVERAAELLEVHDRREGLAAVGRDAGAEAVLELVGAREETWGVHVRQRTWTSDTLVNASVLVGAVQRPSGSPPAAIIDPSGERAKPRRLVAFHAVLKV